MLLKYREWSRKFRESAERGTPLFGTWITIGHPEIVEILSRLPFDWFVFDMEHAPLEFQVVETMLMAMKDTEIAPLVRVSSNDPVAIKKALDLGVAGVLVPLVNSREDAIKAVEAARYPPAGVRGTGPRRCVMYGFEDSTRYFYEWNSNAVVIVQVETKRAYENLEEIVLVDGVTGVFVGPSDLSASMGMYGKVEGSEFTEVIANIAKRVREHGKIAGIMAHTLSLARKAIELGYNFISLSNDVRFLIEGAKKYLIEGANKRL